MDRRLTFESVEAARQWLRAWAGRDFAGADDTALLVAAERGLTWNDELAMDEDDERRLVNARQLLAGAAEREG